MQEPGVASFTTDTVERVHLPKAPLERVFAQVRWGDLSALQSNFPQIADQFGARVGTEFPFTSTALDTNITIGPGGVAASQGPMVKQYRSADDRWRLYFSTVFLTLETTDYLDIDELVTRLDDALVALREVVSIPFVSRIGFRYFNRVTDSAVLEALDQFVAPALVGAAALANNGVYSADQILTIGVYTAGGTTLTTRWAQLPPSATIDPQIEAVAVPSWVLDIDASTEEKIQLDGVLSTTRLLHDAAYSFFRQAVTERFLEHFGETR